jgi:hypothetical protein
VYLKLTTGRKEINKHSEDVMKLDSGILNVIIPAYGVKDFIKPCLDSIYSQTWMNSDNMKVWVCIDGCLETKKVLERISPKYDNLTVLYCKENKGTYITLNTLVSQINEGNILVFGADDMMNPNMIETIMEKGVTGVVRYDGVLIAPVRLVKQLGGFMSWRCAGDTELLDRMKKSGINIHRYPELFFRRRHVNQVTKSAKYKYGSKEREKNITVIKSERPLVIVPEINSFVKLEIKKVSFNIATYPPREKYLKRVIEDVIDKVDIVRICLNEYTKVPEWLSEMNSSKIVTHIPKKNLKDRGKFLWSNKNRCEFYFSGDDDLLYSKEYFKKHLKYLIDNSENIVTTHGRVLKDNSLSLKDYIRYFPTLKNQDTDQIVTIGGTGVMCIDLEKIKIDLKDIECEGMTDIGVAVIMNEINENIICREHNANELEYILDTKEDTLWNNCTGHEKLLKRIKYNNTDIQIYLINKDNDLDRLLKMKKYNIKYNRISPVKLNDKELIALSKKNMSLGIKELSNLLTFRNIISLAKNEGTKRILILEDDVIFEKCLYSVLDKINSLPNDFGICYLGCYFKNNLSDGKLTKYNNNFLEIKPKMNIWGAHAVIFNETVYDKMIRDLTSPKMITDRYLASEIVSKYRCFVLNPMIAFQNEMFIQNSMHNVSLKNLKSESIDFIAKNTIVDLITEN